MGGKCKALENFGLSAESSYTNGNILQVNTRVRFVRATGHGLIYCGFADQTVPKMLSG